MAAEGSTASELPTEMLERVFSCLDQGDLQAVVQVCRSWRSAGEAPGLWTWLLPTATRQNVAFAEEVLASRRMREVRELRVENCHMESQQIVNAINRHSKLSRVTFNNCNLTPAQPKALAVALTALIDFEIQDSVLDKNQLSMIFTQMAESSTLRSICICKTDLSSKIPGLLARALKNLRHVALSDTRLTRDQLEAIFTTLGQDTKMISLKMERIETVSLVDAQLLASIVKQLKVVSFSNIQLTSQQAKAICFAICEDSTLKVFSCKSLHLVAFGRGG